MICQVFDIRREDFLNDLGASAQVAEEHHEGVLLTSSLHHHVALLARRLLAGRSAGLLPSHEWIISQNQYTFLVIASK